MNCEIPKPIRTTAIEIGRTTTLRVVIECTSNRKPTVPEVLVAIDEARSNMLRKAKEDLNKMDL